MSRGTFRAYYAAAVALCLLTSRPLMADSKRGGLYTRAAVGPAFLWIPKTSGRAIVETPTRESFADYTASYAGGGLELELVLGGARGAWNGGGMLGIGWFEGEHFDVDRSALAAAGVELSSQRRSFFLGGAAERECAAGLPWRIGFAAGIAGAFVQFDVPGATRTTGGDDTVGIGGAFLIGPHFALDSRRLFFFGVRSEVAAFLTEDGAFGWGTLLVDVSYH